MRILSHQLGRSLLGSLLSGGASGRSLVVLVEPGDDPEKIRAALAQLDKSAVPAVILADTPSPVLEASTKALESLKDLVGPPPALSGLLPASPPWEHQNHKTHFPLASVRKLKGYSQHIRPRYNPYMGR